ncbi:MAG: SH3 domain-containing protein [Anaerolineae bacterium]|nr:SH3 domain-containing protein [Anaerolineae bacterium]
MKHKLSTALRKCVPGFFVPKLSLGTSRRGWVLALPLVLSLASLGCGLSGSLSELLGNNNPPTPTRIPLPTFTPTPANIVMIDVNAQPTSTATLEPSPTPEIFEPSPTPPPPPPDTPEPVSAAVTVTILKDMNVRGGPGTNYPVLGTAPVGASSNVVGRNADSTWLQVEYPPGSSTTGWVYAPLVQVDGNPEVVAVAAVSEPPAAPPPEESPPEESPPPAPEPPKYQFTPGAWHASENAGICHFKGRMRDEAGNFVYGYSVYVTNLSWGAISHPAGASHHYPDKNEEWDVAGIELQNCPGWWYLSVVRYECADFQARFEAQCKEFTRLSEEIPVEVVYPDEMVINADWVCHWDCDKGLYSQPLPRP